MRGGNGDGTGGQEQSVPSVPSFFLPLFSRAISFRPLLVHALKHPTTHTMSQHNSFKTSAATGSTKRTVLKRFERLDLLKKRGQWKGQKLTGLPKTKPDV
jgi:small basic protein (TIGR04137 family)